MHCDDCGRPSHEPVIGYGRRYDVPAWSPWLVRVEVPAIAPGDEGMALGAPAYVRVEHVCPRCQRERISAAPKPAEGEGDLARLRRIEAAARATIDDYLGADNGAELGEWPTMDALGEALDEAIDIMSQQDKYGVHPKGGSRRSRS